MTELEKQAKREEEALAKQEKKASAFDPMEGRKFIRKMSQESKDRLKAAVAGARKKGMGRRLRKKTLKKQNKEGMGKAAALPATQIKNPMPEKKLMTRKYGGKILKKYRR
jgi:hypothetical protein